MFISLLVFLIDHSGASAILFHPEVQHLPLEHALSYFHLRIRVMRIPKPLCFQGQAKREPEAMDPAAHQPVALAAARRGHCWEPSKGCLVVQLLCPSCNKGAASLGARVTTLCACLVCSHRFPKRDVLPPELGMERFQPETACQLNTQHPRLSLSWKSISEWKRVVHLFV